MKVTLGSFNEILSVGKSGLNAARARLTVAGYNIANASTPGYHREVLTLSAHAVLGGGVSFGNPVAIRNNLLTRNLVSAYGRVGYHQGSFNTLVQVQETFNELDGIGLMSSLDQFQATLKELASNPSGGSERQAVLGSATTLISQFHSIANQLGSAMDSTEGLALEMGLQITLKAEQVFALNQEIRALTATGVNPESMTDERERIIGELGEMVDLTVVHQKNGSVDLYIAGGRPLVTDAGSSTVTAVATSGQPRGIALEIIKGNGITVVPMDDIGGRLGGVIDAMNETLGPALQVMDEIAFGLANAFNAVHAAGTALDGTSGSLFFDVPATSLGAAGGIQVHADVEGLPDRIAAATTAVVNDIPGDNTNLYNLADTLDATGVVAVTGESVHEAYETVMVGVGRSINSAELGIRTERASATQLTNLLLSETGVSVDEEMIEMTMANRAFEASATVIRQAERMAETLMGLVG
jgi:flagellar hook-associated protein 1 FlgK